MPSAQRDYYEVLGVAKTADAEEIKRAYRRLAMKHHPDRNPGDAEAEKAFKEAAAAYEVLSDDQKRKRYDQFGHEGVKGQGSATHDFNRMNVDDIFSMFGDLFGGGGMGGGRGGGRRGPARGYDLETEVSLTLEEAFTGAERDVEFTRLDVCGKCSGSGAKPGSKPVKCTTCGGQGKVQQSGLGGMFRMVVACPACGGRGTVIKEFCDGCKGKGRVPTGRKLTVRIPAGIADGQAVRIRGEGEPPAPEDSQGGEGTRGDLHVVVRVKRHNVFQREGDTLAIEVPIGFAKASLGGTVDLPTIDGKKATLTVPKGTQHGAMFKLTGQGMPGVRDGTRGDMIAVTKLEVPKKLTPEQEKLLHEFARLEGDTVFEPEQGFWKKVKDKFS